MLRVAPQASALCRLGIPVLWVEPRCSLQPAELPGPFCALEEEFLGHVPQECLTGRAFCHSLGRYHGEVPVTDVFALSFLECSGLSVCFIFITLFDLMGQPGFAGLQGWLILTDLCHHLH